MVNARTNYNKTKLKKDINVNRKKDSGLVQWQIQILDSFGIKFK
jgi:hypothetical protein